MKKWFILTVLTATSVFAATVTPAGPWQTVTTPATIPPGSEVITSSVNTNGTSSAFWNNATDDANNCQNVGCFLIGASGLPNSPNLVNPVYLGNNDGSSLTNFNFGDAAAAGTQMLAEIAGNFGTNWLGWYDATLTPAGLTAGNRTTSWDIIYTGGDGVGATAAFTPTATFGLFFLPDFGVAPKTDAEIVTALNTNAYYTQASKNTTDTLPSPYQHFALFARSAAASAVIPADFWVGVEDKNFGPGPNYTSDGDYNDMIIHLRLVPEPGYFILLSLGLGGLGLAHRRLKKVS